MHNYKKLDVWVDAVNFVTQIYEVTKLFPVEEKYGMVSQINRSAVSIPSNIAEGAGRSSDKEFALFLGYSIASSFELETQIIISCNLKYITENKRDEVLENLNVVQRKIRNLITSLKSKN